MLLLLPLLDSDARLKEALGPLGVVDLLAVEGEQSLRVVLRKTALHDYNLFRSSFALQLGQQSAYLSL